MAVLDSAAFLEVGTRTVYSDAAGARTKDHGSTDSMVSMVYGITLTIWLTALLVVCVRIYSRIWITKFRGQDDWWMVVACVFAAGDQTLKIIWLQHGLGRRFESVSLEDFAVFAKIGYAIAVQYPWSLGVVKISVLTFYLRLFPYETFRKCCYAMMAFVVCMTLALSIAQIFSCSPVSDSWSLSPVGHCFDKAALQYSGSVLNLVTDIIILLMPMKYLFALTMDKRRRYGVIGLFALGLVTCVASILRLFTVHLFYTSSDPTWNATEIAIWSCIEINLTIITASIPAVKPIFMKLIINPVKKLMGKPVTSTGDTRVSTKHSDLSTDRTRVAPDLEHYRSPSTGQIAQLQPWPADEEEDSIEERGNLDFYTMLRNDNARHKSAATRNINERDNGQEIGTGMSRLRSLEMM